MEKIKNKGQATIFSSPVLEILTKTSPVITLCLYVPVLSGFVYAAYNLNVVDSLYTGIFIFSTAFLFWTLFEYIMHRYVFHFISESELVKQFHYMVHGVHHEYPRDKERLFMPPVPAMLIIASLYFIFRIVMGNYVFIFLPGFLSGYLVYAFLHYFMHTVNPPKMLKPLWRHHALHHYKYPDKAFGVSSPLWDYIFRTMPPK